MLQAFLVLPAFALAYLVAGPPRLGRRIWQLLAGAAVLVAAAGWWIAAVMLTPAADRPYVGGSTNDSILQLALGYNGLGRLDGNETGSVGFGAGRSPAFSGATGLGRLFGTDMGGQISWLLPAALLALAALAWASRRAPRTDRTRAAVLLWGGWLLITGLVFSFMAGIIHPYYTVALAPPIGALVGIGATRLWRARARWAARGALAAGVTVTALWSYCAARPHPRLAPAVACGDRGRRAHRRGGLAGRAGPGAPGQDGARPHRAGRGAGLAGAARGLRRAGGLQPRHRRRCAYRGDPVGGPGAGRRGAVPAEPARPGGEPAPRAGTGLASRSPRRQQRPAGRGDRWQCRRQQPVRRDRRGGLARPGRHARPAAGRPVRAAGSAAPPR